jgi:hypothetical protein
MRRTMILAAMFGLLLAASAGLATAEVIQRGNLRVSTTATMRPRALPRTSTAPISVSIAGQIATADETQPPPLKELRIQINRHGRLEYQGLPICEIARIQPASDSRALANCRDALVGEGHFSGTITLPGSSTEPIEGRLLLFNGQEHGRPVLLGHVYAPHPFATSFVIVFRISTGESGTYGTTLTADLAKALGRKRSLTGIEMTLSRRWSSSGSQHSYLSAGCPAPEGFPGATFPLARTIFSFAGGTRIASTLTRNCKAR